MACLAEGRAQELRDFTLEDGSARRCCVALPATDGWMPVIVVFPDSAGEAAARAAVQAIGVEPVAAGCAVVAPVRTADGTPASLAPLLTALRRAIRIEHGGMHAAVGADAAWAIAAVLASRHEFQSFTAFGAAAGADLGAVRRLPARRVHALDGTAGASLAPHFARLRAERSPPGVAGSVDRTLDDFHDAAANGDEARYFAILPDDAVFLGTDGTERWTGTEFRAFALPYFQRDSAWTYVPLVRHVHVEPGETVAWFDERLDNAAYGECRGSGVLIKRADRWVLRQYNLTIAVPNDLARGLAARVRAMVDGASTPVTTIVLVRHGEKVDAATDAELNAAGQARAGALARALRDLPLTAAYTSQFRRTADTVGPTCKTHGLTAIVVPAADGRTLAARLRNDYAGQTVLVCGHSNTLPELVKALGIRQPPTIADDEYDRLFIVTLDADGASLLSLRYGSP
ncbi:MAG: nuclear transport factor 2 family protein [Planctomycetota bacterium]